jgi:hypothetical protein
MLESMESMENSIFLAKIIGLVFLFLGLATLINREWYRQLITDFFDDRGLVYLSGVLTLVTGIAIVLVHNVWAPDWRILITILGWIAIAKGVMRLTFPALAMRSAKKFSTTTTPTIFSGVSVLVLGVVLASMGYLN